MTTLTDQELQDVTQGTTEPKDAEFNEVTAKRFIGSLTGNATTATQLQNNFSVVFNGDVEGRLSDCNGAGGYVVNVKVNESNHAKSAEFTAKTNYSDHAHFADLANLATHSLTTDLAHNSEHSNESDEALHSVESDHALQSDKSLQADNANNAKESEHALNSDNSLHAVQADTDNKERNIADTFDAILYTDLPAIRTDIVNITPTEHTVEFKDKEYKLSNTLLADEDNENKLLQDFSNSIEDVDNRITNLETTTDLGKVTVRLNALEQKDIELKSEIDANANSISSNITAISNNTTAITKNATDISELKQTVNNNKTASDNQFSTINSDISSLQSTAANHALRIEQNTSSTASLNSEVSKVRSDFESADTTINEKVNSIESNLENYQLKSDAVKTVNGINADENGNVEITASGLELGDIGLAPLGIDETDNCRRYLNGQIILQSQFEAFTTKLKSAITLYPNLVTSEDNWQSAVTLSPLGQCGKFVIDDEAGTIRLPKVVNVMGALDLSTIGQTVEAGLPNITGSATAWQFTGQIDPSTYPDYFATNNKALYWLSPTDAGINTTGKNLSTNSGPGKSSSSAISIDASRSNSIYGNSETVQQESIKYPYFIQVATSNNEDVQIDTQVRLNNPFSLFMPYWSPIELNNLSWLRSNKQWNNGAVYVSAYEFLLSKYNAGTEQTETIADVSVTYKLADNGMKIITDKSVYDALISASGSAWFFVLDTENTQFVLPYTNGFAQFGNELGKFTEAGLPNITGETGAGYKQNGADVVNGKLVKSIQNSTPHLAFESVSIQAYRQIFDASLSNPIYGNSDTVQPNSVTGYLYFYVGEVEQDANIIATSGLAESVSRKADNDLSNVTAPTQAFKDMVVGWGMPDYSSGVDIGSNFATLGGSWTAPSDGFIEAIANTPSSPFIFLYTQPNSNILSNDNTFLKLSFSGSDSNSISVIVPILKGQTVYQTSQSPYYFRTAQGKITFYPCKGAN